ncbi:hypothetical protein GCM10027521_26400 [Amycolatopsis cihanbeyliensis]
MPGTGLGQDLQRGEFLAGLQRRAFGLVPQLEDVHPTGQRGIGELGEVATLGPGVGTQVQPGFGEAVTDLVTIETWHGATVVARDTVKVSAREPEGTG